MNHQGRGAGAAGTAWLAVGPACVACTIPAFWHSAVALGLVGAATWAHYTSLAMTPLIAVVVLNDWRRHRDRAVLLFSVTGLAVVSVHIGMHVAYWELHSTLFDLSNQVGLGLLTMAVLLNTRVLWRLRRQRVAVTP